MPHFYKILDVEMGLNQGTIWSSQHPTNGRFQSVTILHTQLFHNYSTGAFFSSLYDKFAIFEIKL